MFLYRAVPVHVRCKCFKHTLLHYTASCVFASHGTSLISKVPLSSWRLILQTVVGFMTSNSKTCSFHQQTGVN